MIQVFFLFGISNWGQLTANSQAAFCCQSAPERRCLKSGTDIYSNSLPFFDLSISSFSPCNTTLSSSLTHTHTHKHTHTHTPTHTHTHKKTHYSQTYISIHKHTHTHSFLWYS